MRIYITDAWHTQKCGLAAVQQPALLSSATGLVAPAVIAGMLMSHNATLHVSVHCKQKTDGCGSIRVNMYKLCLQPSVNTAITVWQALHLSVQYDLLVGWDSLYL
jgi:hypothetical protein